MIIWWVTECVPLGFTSILAPFIFVVSGILSIDQALQKFSDPIIWIFISGFILAAAFKKSGLDERIAYNLALLYKGNNPKIAVFFIACLPVFILSITGSITASSTIVFPFVVAFLNILGITSDNISKDKENINKHQNNENSLAKHDSNKIKGDTKSNFIEASFLSLGQAATSGALLLLISTAPNLIAKATVEDFVPGETISFVDWFIIGFPHAIIGLILSWYIVFLFVKPEIHSLSSFSSNFKDRLLKLGIMSAQEKSVLIILVIALSLWIAPSLLRSFYEDDLSSGNDQDFFSLSLNAFIKNIPESLPALLIILSIGLVRVRRKEDSDNSSYTDHKNVRTPLLTWNEMLKSIDWNIIFLFGGGLILGMGIEQSGLAQIMGTQISDIAGNNLTEISIFIMVAIVSFGLSYAISNTASAIIMCPLAASLAVGAGFNPIPPIIAAGIAVSISSGIPSAAPPMAIIYSSKKVSIWNMFKTGFTSDLLRLLILIILGPLLIGLVS